VIFSTENGTFLHDEVNRLPAGSNGGWPLVEGSAGANPPAVANGTYIEPIVEYPGIRVPTGIDFAPDATFGPVSDGQLFVGLFNTGQIIRYTLNDARDAVTAEATFATGIANGITDVAFAPDGTLYVLTTRTILRIVPE
jgi:glucose/arabinose dehydrogenase